MAGGGGAGRSMREAGKRTRARRRSRRALLAAAVAGALGAGLAPRPGRADGSGSRATATGRTWLLAAADELRPPPPSAPSDAERAELLHLQARRDEASDALVRHWGTGPAVLPWTAVALDLIERRWPSPVRAARALALLHAAVADAVTAAWDAKDTYQRPPPAAVEPALRPLADAAPTYASFPSEHAAVAGAAATVLAYLFPDEAADSVHALAEEAAGSRLWAGAAYRSDIAAGLALGRAVGERAVARGEMDGSAVLWDGSGRLWEEGTWRPTPPGYEPAPLDPRAGTWRTWVVEDIPVLRPPPPPAYDSPEWRAQLALVQRAVRERTPAQAAAARFWSGGRGTVTPAGLWVEIARDLILRDRLDLPQAARVLAATSLAIADAFICCWDAKYAYWSGRPVTFDRTLAVLIATPPFPSYTSGHATISGAASVVLGQLFPADAAALAARAEEAKDSRLWAGIHFPIDNEAGIAGGRAIGRLVTRAALLV